jgi:hypothetical protein
MAEPRMEHRASSQSTGSEPKGAELGIWFWVRSLVDIRVLTLVLLIGIVVLGACSDDDAETIAATVTTESTATPTPEPAQPDTLDPEVTPTPEPAPESQDIPVADDVLYESDMAHLTGVWSGAVVLQTELIIGNPDAQWETDVRLVTEPTADARACLMVRIEEDDPNEPYYFFCMHGDGTSEAAFQRADGEMDVLLPRASRDAGSDPNQWITLSIIARGDDFWFLINDQLVGTANHSGTSEGAVGVGVEVESDDVTQFEFRNFVIRALE